MPRSIERKIRDRASLGGLPADRLAWFGRAVGQVLEEGLTAEELAAFRREVYERGGIVVRSNLKADA